MNLEKIIEHCNILNSSYRRWFGEPLVKGRSKEEIWVKINEAPFVVVSHGVEEDPVFNYANKKALELWEMTWEEFTSLPSRSSAEKSMEPERQKMLQEALKTGFIRNYEGVRTSRSGRRFRIEDVILWNVHDEDGRRIGQAATFPHWTFLN